MSPTRCYCGRRLLCNDDGTTECVRCHRQPDECSCENLILSDPPEKMEP